MEESLIDFINYTTSLGVGEILLTSVDKEGTWEGYDTDLIDRINNMIEIPLIANGGCGSIDDIKTVLYENKLQAASIGSMSVYQKKDMEF